MNYTFIGDIHSAADDLEVLLQAQDIQGSRLIFLGDYIDGVSTRTGTHTTDSLEPLKVLDIVMDRVRHYEDVALLGNHDDFWLQTAYGDDLSYQTWRLNGGANTWRQLGIHSNSPIIVTDALNQQPLARYTKFLAQLPLSWSTASLLAVHAGIDWNFPVDQQVRDDMMWIRDDYYFDKTKNFHPNKIGRIMVTGHTPVQSIKNDGYGFLKMQADPQDTPRYLIDAGSRSGAANGGIFALTLSETGDVLAKNWVIKQQLLDGNLPHLYD
ncbi:metallophosphoesterase [Lactiplantibacillus mudanjiangensis]|uniref:Serine/threonine protein phosphatase [Lactobacillus brevis] n=1 Tax=Lactiplantibacillus mudanjiangensis TaxID=1296538 RepID=A0A660DZB4_9LACO|nr:metallophosphoesterase [Lactiplantibacillus mudanjiangensis]VDG18175.1 serine/threonine protein phosphatase [Lactobacillus brevis] [Lactiplantibacillus mudanjiangensis]VDG25869.1 serine/threonine protein phosphatase [Lactobacillus brevis] [Lactiplantibacillus mudanjiangensis]VDG28702.1 serine/threonine protein phosphatase [Lactobacillus brevis] [Lactiplantibacillus mudanjiangensis]